MRRAVTRRCLSSGVVGEEKVMDINKVDFGAVRIEVTDRPETLDLLTQEQRRWFVENKPEYFDSVDIQDPKTIKEWLTQQVVRLDFARTSVQSRMYGERMAVTIMNHINNPDWAVLFGLKEMYLEVTMWLFGIHMWLVQKRLWVLPEAAAINKAMTDMFTRTADQRLETLCSTGRERRLHLERFQGLYHKSIVALDEAFHRDCQYHDAMMLYALYRNSPIEHREEVPFYAWFTLVQYIRVHLAVLDRIPNEEVKQGFFYFYHPMDSELFDPPPALDNPRYVTDLLQKRRGGIRPPNPAEA